jgi:hypothetical protein
MRYLITIKNQQPYFTDWFTLENNFGPNSEMIVYDF